MIGLSRPDHAVARRDGDGRRARCSAQGFDAAAADRRRDDQQGRTPRCGSTRATRARSIHVLDASRAVGVASALVSDTQREPLIAEDRRRLRRSARVAPAQRPKRARDARRGARQRLPLDPAGQAPPPAVSGPAHLRRVAAARAARRDRLDAVLPRLGAGRQLSGDPRRPGGRRKRAQACSPTRSEMLDQHHRRAVADAEGDGRPVALQARGRRRRGARRDND